MAAESVAATEAVLVAAREVTVAKLVAATAVRRSPGLRRGAAGRRAKMLLLLMMMMMKLPLLLMMMMTMTMLW